MLKERSCESPIEVKKSWKTKRRGEVKKYLSVIPDGMRFHMRWMWHPLGGMRGSTSKLHFKGVTLMWRDQQKKEYKNNIGVKL